MMLQLLRGRARRKARRDGVSQPRQMDPVARQPETPVRVWSLLMPVGYPTERR